MIYAASGRGMDRLARQVLEMLRDQSRQATRAGMLPWAPVFMALGIGGWFSLLDEPGGMFYLTCGLAAVYALIWSRRARQTAFSPTTDANLRIFAMAVFLVALGACLAGLRAHLVAAPILDFRYYGAVEGRVVEIDRSSRDRLRLTLDQVVLGDMPPEHTPRRVRISLLSDERLPVQGQKVMLSAHLGPPSGPAEPRGFDYRRVAWFERLGALGYTRSPVVTTEPAAPGGWLALHRTRLALSAAIQAQIGGQAGAVSAALITGDRSGISETTNQAMRDSNLYHIVSISGLHMSMLTGFIYVCLRCMLVGIAGLCHRPTGRLHKWSAGGAFLGAAGYLWLSGGDVATERSFLMIAVMLLAIILDRRAVSLRTLALAAAVILALTPEALLSPGFQMSFAATFALILVIRPWQSLAPSLPFWLRPVAMLLISSLVAGLATAPIAAAHFGRLTQYGLIANLLVVPVVGTIVMPAAVVSAITAPFGLSALPLWLMGLGTTWMLEVARWIAALGGAVYLVPAPPAAVLPLFAVGACLFCLPALAFGSSPICLSFRKAASLCMVIASGFLWHGHVRPFLLISAQGDAVAMMTGEARVPSKATGGAYVVSQWLEADGDRANQAVAAGRPFWTGPPNLRKGALDFSGGRHAIYHLTGKKSALAVPDLCKENTIIVANTPLEDLARTESPCLMFDSKALRKTGAIAITASGRSETAAELSGSRMWSNARPMQRLR